MEYKLYAIEPKTGAETEIAGGFTDPKAAMCAVHRVVRADRTQPIRIRDSKGKSMGGGNLSKINAPGSMPRLLMLSLSTIEG